MGAGEGNLRRQCRHVARRASLPKGQTKYVETTYFLPRLADRVGKSVGLSTRLRVRGGNPPAQVYYGWHKFWDGTPEVANLDSQGTNPPGGLRLLRTIDMTDLGASYTECCYVLDLWVSDASIRHNFNTFQAYPSQPGWAWPNDFLTFAAAP